MGRLGDLTDDTDDSDDTDDTDDDAGDDYTGASDDDAGGDGGTFTNVDNSPSLPLSPGTTNPGDPVVNPWASEEADYQQLTNLLGVNDTTPGGGGATPSTGGVTNLLNNAGTALQNALGGGGGTPNPPGISALTKVTGAIVVVGIAVILFELTPVIQTVFHPKS